MTPKNNFEEGKTIKLELYPIEGYVLGEYNFTLIEVLKKGQLICSFQEDSYVSPGEVEIRLDAKDASTGQYFSVSTDTKVPFIVGENSTAVEHVHYEFVDNSDKVFVIPARRSYGTMKVRFLKWEEGKTTLFLLVPDDNERVLPGGVDQTEIVINGTATPERLEGKWMFQKLTSIDFLKMAARHSGEEIEKMPENNLSTDMPEFKNGGTQLKVSATGGMAKYFRDSDISFVKERLIYLYEYSMIGRPPQVTISMMGFSRANVNFSSTNEKVRSVQVGFRLLEDNDTLEVSVFDYEPTDFLYNTYKELAAWSGVGDFPMEMYTVRYYFTRVK